MLSFFVYIYIYFKKDDLYKKYIRRNDLLLHEKLPLLRLYCICFSIYPVLLLTKNLLTKNTDPIDTKF